MILGCGNRCACAWRRRAPACWASRPAVPPWKRSTAATSTWSFWICGWEPTPDSICCRKCWRGNQISASSSSRRSPPSRAPSMRSSGGRSITCRSPSRPIRSGWPPIAWSKASAFGVNWRNSKRNSTRAASQPSSNRRARRFCVSCTPRLERPPQMPCSCCAARAARARTSWLDGFVRTVPGESAPFVTVNCPALSGDLMTSALFGHRKGAFTGAVADVAGKVQEAEGGTLLLDEVGELTADAQARLLRFLNDRTYERLGEPRERQADVRLIAATNRELENEVRVGQISRGSLLPSAMWCRSRCRRSGTVRRTFCCSRATTSSIFSRKQRRHGLTFASVTEQAMVSHAWPGNLRELRNAVERAVILAAHRRLSPPISAFLSHRRADTGRRRRRCMSARQSRSNRSNASTSPESSPNPPLSKAPPACWKSMRRRCSGSASDTELA